MFNNIFFWLGSKQTNTLFMPPNIEFPDYNILKIQVQPAVKFYNLPDCYKSSRSKPRGFALIINYQQIHQEKPRVGSEIDGQCRCCFRHSRVLAQ
jgi:hypothetical protein